MNSSFQGKCSHHIISVKDLYKKRANINVNVQAFTPFRLKFSNFRTTQKSFSPNRLNAAEVRADSSASLRKPGMIIQMINSPTKLKFIGNKAYNISVNSYNRKSIKSGLINYISFDSRKYIKKIGNTILDGLHATKASLNVSVPSSKSPTIRKELSSKKKYSLPREAEALRGWD